MRIMASRTVSSVDARFVRARRASNVGSRFLCSEVGSSINRTVSGRIADVIGRREEEKTCDGFVDMSMRESALAAVRVVV